MAVRKEPVHLHLRDDNRSLLPLLFLFSLAGADVQPLYPSVFLFSILPLTVLATIPVLSPNPPPPLLLPPERILGQDYSIKSDVWSLGLSLLEVANNRFPFPPEGEPPIVGQFDLLNFIVNQPPPALVDDEEVVWSDGAKDLVKLWFVSSSKNPHHLSFFL
jgi:serine/threonine protein kinase